MQRPYLTALVLVGLALIASFASVEVFAHQGQAHPGPAANTQMARKESPSGVSAIREDYRRRVEPIFKKSCMDCHSSQTRYPWYHKVPGIRQLLDSDISEARHHLDFSEGYPFKSHATPTEDLDAIAESIQKGAMPPFSYRVMHRDAAMSDDEKNTVLNWVETSKLLLKGKGK